jgi:hypothetical protein
MGSGYAGLSSNADVDVDERPCHAQTVNDQPDREMNLRYAGACTLCGEQIPAGGRGIYSPSSRSVRHIVCGELDRGTAGGSAYREHDRRSVRDQARTDAHKQRITDAYGDGFLGRVATFLAVDDSPRRSTKVWAQGAIGEERVAGILDSLSEVGVISLHDRRIPGTRANIDHIAITPWGVWVIDTKRYIDKRPDVRSEGGFLGIGATDRLTVGGRNQDKLVDGVLRQVDLVSAALDSVPVRGALCFVESDWPLFGGDFTIRDVRVFWPKRLAKELLRKTPPTIDPVAVSRRLAAAFPRA